MQLLWRDAENFAPLSHRAIFEDIEVSAGTDALWDMSSRTVVETGVVHRRRRRRRCRRENKICQITEPAGSMRTLYKSRRWPWVAYCNLNLFVLSFRKNEKEAQRANPFALIAWLSVANVDHVCATDFWHQIQKKFTNSRKFSKYKSSEAVLSEEHYL